MENEGKTLLLEIIGEIEQADPEMFKPPQKICSHDKKIATIEDTFIKKLFALSTFYSREAERVKASLKYEPENEELRIEFNKLDSKEDLLREMLWFCIRTQYNLWKYQEVGLRKEWCIVEDTHDSDGSTDFLKKLMGG